MKTLFTKGPTKAICIAVALLMLPLPASAYPPDPDNAALLYYQASLCYEEPNKTTQNLVDKLSKGEIEPNEQIRKYIDDCQTAIELAAAAADIPNCDWGLKYSDGFSMQMVHLAQARHLNRLLVADARIRMADGAYRKAVDRYLTAGKMAQHTGDETIISFLVSVAISRLTDSCIQDILGDMPDDLETLTSLQNELTLISQKTLSVQTALKTEEILRLEHLEKPTEMLVGKPFQNADESFVEKNRDYYKKYMNSIYDILSSQMSYEVTYAKLKELSGKAEKDAAENPAAILAGRMAPRLFSIFGHEVRTGTFFNAIRAAVEVYIIKAKSGRLPDELPADLPKDLFSDKDFEYEKTKSGFTLRCRGKDLDKDEIYQYEFKVAK
jgi:hypothetical protein